MYNRKRTSLLALTLAVTVMLFVAVISTMAGGGGMNGGDMYVGNLIYNGGFEHGFSAQNSCGMVGEGWGCFTSGGQAGYGFYDDQWERVVASGSHAQLIEVNTKQEFGGQNHTAGIFQQVSVIPGEIYTLNLQALMRANDLDSGGDPWRYVMLVGFTHDGSANWQDAIVQEIDVGPIQDRVDPSGYYPVSLQVQAMGERLTVFMAGRMKWGDWKREVDFNVDDVSLIGAQYETMPPEPVHPIEPPPPPPQEIVSTMLVCDSYNHIRGGDFEKGFQTNGVGRYWAPYNNGGAATFGYYDDAWAPVVARNHHAQLLEINTYGRAATEPNRLIGIYQTVDGLEPGATYEFGVRSMIREAVVHSEEDSNRYEVYWGYEHGSNPGWDPTALDGWYGMPVDDIYLRTDPGPYSSFSQHFVADSQSMVLYLFGLKKWATVEREVNFDFDVAYIKKCREVEVHEPAPPVVDHYHYDKHVDAIPPSHPPVATQPAMCSYLVEAGDTLATIAWQVGTTPRALAKMNDIGSPYTIWVMQPLTVPCHGNHALYMAPAASSTITQPQQVAESHTPKKPKSGSADAGRTTGGTEGGDAGRKRGSETDAYQLFEDNGVTVRQIR